jgi:peptidoglycan/xylan/chitin deacetylase (PgdA/CDA1 family)
MQKKYIPIAVFFVILLVFLAHFGARLTLAEPAFTFAETQKEVYLTFDDGPSTKVTNRILDTLKKENVKATFFIVSDRVSGREETLRRIATEGHTVGVHSKSHEYSKIYATDQSLLDDIAGCANVIERVTGVTPKFYRFPGGGLKDRERRAKLIEAQGYTVVGWNAVCGDEEIKNASAKMLFETAVKTSAGQNTVVLLCHDSAFRKETAEALPDIIAYYRAQGYVFRAF